MAITALWGPGVADKKSVSVDNTAESTPLLDENSNIVKFRTHSAKKKSSVTGYAASMSPTFTATNGQEGTKVIVGHKVSGQIGDWAEETIDEEEAMPVVAASSGT